MQKHNDEYYKDKLKETIEMVRAIGVEYDYWDDNFFKKRGKRYIGDAKRLAKFAKTGAKVLDVGALPGHVVLFMKNLGYDVTGVDIDPSRAQQLIDKYDLDIQKCNVETEKLPFPDNTFDVVIMTEIFEHLRIDPLFTLEEARRVIKKGGILFLSTPNFYGMDKIGKFVTGRGFNDPLKQFKFLREHGHMGHIREYSTMEMKRLMRYCGLEPKKTFYHNYHNYDNGILFVLINFVEIFLPFLKTRQIIVAEKKAND